MAKIRNYSDNQHIELEGNVTSYVCGPTVYGSVHIGNIRPILTMDIFANALKASGMDMNLVHNITDIDDKIIQKSIDANMTEKEVSEKYTAEYLDILKELNINNITQTPKVTDYISQMHDVISQLIEKGFAYEVNGSVYFRVGKIDTYGLQHKVTNNEHDHDEAPNADKENHIDFAL